mgnify:CR=1 FL=1
MSLKDKRVVVTRAPHQAEALVQLLRQRGAVPLIYPCIDIAPPADTSAIDATLHNLQAYDWLVLTSSNTVIALHRRLGALQIVPDWRQIKIAAVGTATAEAVSAHFGTTVDFIPDTQTGEALAETIEIDHGAQVILPKSALADDHLAQALRDKSAVVREIVAYETVMGSGGEDVPALITAGEVNAITFTSPSTVENFMERIHPVMALDIPVAVIGTTTAAKAREWGFQRVILPDHFSLEMMVNALSESI